jgi:hypothetical protein
MLQTFRFRKSRRPRVAVAVVRDGLAHWPRSDIRVGVVW